MYFFISLQGIAGPDGLPGFAGPRGPEGFLVCKLVYVSRPLDCSLRRHIQLQICGSYT